MLAGLYAAIVAQLVRALDCGSRSRGFKSRQSPFSHGSWFFQLLFLFPPFLESSFYVLLEKSWVPEARGYMQGKKGSKKNSGNKKESKPWPAWALPTFFLSLGGVGLIATVTFYTDHPAGNWLGALGHSIAYFSRFILGICAPFVFLWMIVRSLDYFQGKSQDHHFPLISILPAIVSGALLTTIFAENYPSAAKSFTSWVHVQTLSTPSSGSRVLYDRYNLGGVPLYFLYKDIPHLNLQHLLSDRGLTLIAGSYLVGLATIYLRRRRERRPLESLIPSFAGEESAPANPLEKLEALQEARQIKPSIKTMAMNQAPAAVEKPAQLAPNHEPATPLSTVALVKKAKAKLARGQTTGYTLPSLELLTEGKVFDPHKLEGEITQQSRLLEETLLSFGIESKVGDVHVGPRLLSFEVHPAIGVKVQRIKALENDIALNLEAKSLRIIAPIPGKAAVGIEVPSKYPQEVNFKQMVQNYRAGKERYNIPVILGKTVNGEDVIFDLTKMPHMIIAGATGSGKSVCVNTIIMSILMHASHEEIRLMMVDPKKVELTPYNRLPHMIAPVITEPHHACEALRWLVVEMERRYEILKRMSLRHIEAFNQRARDEAFESTLGIEIPVKLPYIVGIIDELADLMMTSPADIETPIARIAQMARAVGIHLILATQRPSREVITGLIKANFPARIAFKVSSRINSQIILDEIGAECLLGNGDMLFLHPTKGSLMRAQGSYIRDEDINRVIETIEMQAPTNYILKPDLLGEAPIIKGSGASEDELFESAKALIIETGTASTTFLQRKLRIGYARAASLMDELEEHGIVSPSDGGKPRRVLSSGSDSTDGEIIE